MSNTITHAVKGKRGIDDLKGYLGDMATEWWTEEDWREYNRRGPARERFNRWYIGWLKRNGHFGEEYELKFTLVYNPALDEPRIALGPSLTSSRLVFLDIT